MADSILSQPDPVRNTASPASQPATIEVDQFFALIETILLSLVARLGPFVVALMPSLFTGYSVYETLYQKAGAELAFIFALAVAVAIECAGIYLGHNAVRISGWGWLLTGLYVVGVWGIVVFGHAAFSGLALGIGLFSPVLVLSVYISHAMFLQKDSELKQQQAEEARQRKRQERNEDLKNRVNQQLRLERERAKIASNYGPPIGAQLSGQNVQLGVQPGVQPGPNTAQNNAHIAQINAQRKRSVAEELDAVERFLDEHPAASYADIGRFLGRSKSTGENRAKALMAQGRVIRNGHGWEAVQQ